MQNIACEQRKWIKPLSPLYRQALLSAFLFFSLSLVSISMCSRRSATTRKQLATIFYAAMHVRRALCCAHALASHTQGESCGPECVWLAACDLSCTNTAPRERPLHMCDAMTRHLIALMAFQLATYWIKTNALSIIFYFTPCQPLKTSTGGAAAAAADTWRRRPTFVSTPETCSLGQKWKPHMSVHCTPRCGDFYFNDFFLIFWLIAYCYQQNWAYRDSLIQNF